MTTKTFRLGVLVNPYAGIGGALALKGSDGAEVRQQALANGAEQLAPKKMTTALLACVTSASEVQIVTAAGDMGESACQAAGLACEVIYTPANSQTEAFDSECAAEALVNHGIDLLLFAGGDGTARNICAMVEQRVPVLGVPAGCKIHSGVYAVTPSAAGRVVHMMINGELVSERDAEVRDIDENAFRAGKVLAKHYGEMRVPNELTYVQAVKMGGKESEELVLNDIADHIIELMEDHPDDYFVMGSGSTVANVMDLLGLDNTLLGVDVVKGQTLVASDVTAGELIDLTKGHPTRVVITVIGGQGHILGRGNQQLSPMFLKQVGRDALTVIATKAKLQALAGRPLILDTSDPQLDLAWAGRISVITGFHDRVLYPVN